jgi:choline dehydrogenase-like flavoprotein
MEFDYVIVGGGTAGCVIAARLAAADPEISVCLVEAGEAFEHDPLVLGYHGSVPLLGDPKYDFDYPVAPQERGNSRIRQSRARMLGGCSSHNDTVAFLPPARDLAEWEAHGAVGWNAPAVRPYYERAMEQLHIHRAPASSACARAVHQAALDVGLPEVDVHADDFTEGAGWLYLNEHDEIRQSTAVAYLYPLDTLPPNLTLLTETWVSRIVLDDDGSATGVASSRGQIDSRREVVLCAGSIDTPKLLMLSGIGPADELRRAGIEILHDLPGVGEELQDHLEIPLVLETDRDTGPSLQSAENGVFWGTREGYDGFDVYAHIITQPYYVPLELDGRRIAMPSRGFCIVPNAAKPKSIGSLRLNRDDPTGPPVIDPRYLTDPAGEDERALVEGLRLARRMVRETSLGEWVVSEVAPGIAIDAEDDIVRYVRQCSNTVYHPCCTCRIGAADDPGAVVGPDLRVRGIPGLRIADASVFPTMLSVNLCLTTVMIGERCADLILRPAGSRAS